MPANFVRIFGLFLLIQISIFNTLQSQPPGYWKNRLFFKLDNSLPANVQSLEDLGRNPATKAIYQLLMKQPGMEFRKAFLYARSPELDRSFRVTLPPNKDVAILIRQLEQIQGIDYAEREPRHKSTLVPNDPSYSGQYAMNLIQAAAAFNIHTGGNSFVAIVDDACRKTHVDLAANIRTNPGEIAGNFIDDDGNGKVDDTQGWDVADNDANVNPPSTANNNFFSHGTHCSGIACAVTNNSVGIASIGFNCKILPVKCTGNADDPEFIDAAFDGVDYAYDSGARIISCSWGGGGYSNTFNNFVTTMFNNGTIMVCAAGNDGENAVYYPAAYSNAIGVAATNSSDVKAGFSNYGPWVDISAPGVGIYSTVAGSGGSNTSYTNYNGTSMSTPMVAGLLALMLSYDPGLSAADLRDCLLSSATNINAQNPTLIGLLGAGRINALAALQCVGANLLPTPDFTWAPNAEVCPGAKVQFTDASSGGPTSRSWSFPGGNPSSSSALNPLITYANPGTYDVSLTVGNANGSNSVTKTGIIIVGPNGADNFFWETFESGLGSWTVNNPDNSVTWTQGTAVGSRNGTKAISISNFTYAGGVNQRDAITNNTGWDFRGRESITLSLDHAYRGKLSGATDTLNIYVSTNNGATFPYKVYSGFIGPNVVFQTGTSINTAFVPSSANDWCFGGTNSNCISVDLSQFAGRQQVKIKIENVSKFGNTLFLDNIKLTSSCYTSIALPVVNFEGDPLEACHNTIAAFSDESSSNVIAWDWSFPGGNPATSNEQFPIVTYNQPGFYNVTLVATNAGGSATLTKNQYIKVYDDPVPFFEYNVNGATVTFQNMSASGNQQATSYFWDFGDGQFSSATNPTHTYQSDGNYTVRLEATNVCGSVQFFQNIQITQVPIANFNSSIHAGCTPLSISFFDNSGNSVNSWDWSFPGGNPATSNLQNPVVQYNTAGNFPVTLIVHNNVGSDTIVIPNYVSLIAGANAAFTTSVTGLTATFTNQSSGASLTYQWNFGDGNTSTQANPVHEYASSNVYQVRLITSNGCSSDTLIQSVSIQSIPVAAFQGISQLQCLPATVSFNDASQGSVTFRQWSFPGGNPGTSSIAAPNVVYANAGTYSVTLIVGNVAGNDTLVMPVAVIVGEPPIASFDAIVALNTVQLNNGSINGNSWNWDFGDTNTSTVENPTHVFEINGTYTITQIVTNACGSDTFTQQVQIAVPQSTYFGFDMNGTCAPLSVQFSDQSVGNPNEWIWTFDGGNPATSAEPNPVVQYSIPGYYKVSLVTRNGNLSDTLLQDSLILVKGIPVPSFSSLTTGFDVNFSNQSLFGTSYEWKFGDGNISNDENPNHTYAFADSFDVVLVAMNECGSDSIVRTILTGGTAPIGGFQAGSFGPCVPVTVQYSPSNGTSWDEISWTFPGGNPSTSTETNPIVIYENGGEFAVQMALTNAFGTTITTEDSFVSVKETPTANFSAEIESLLADFTNLTLFGTQYFWDFGDGKTSNEIEPIHEYEANGNYLVTLIATNECGSDTIIFSLQLTKVEDLNNLGWTLYPNPAQNKLWVRAPGIISSNTSWKLVSLLGQQLEVTPISVHGEKLYEFDLSEVPPGYWYLQMRNEAGLHYAKILIEN